MNDETFGRVSRVTLPPFRYGIAEPMLRPFALSGRMGERRVFELMPHSPMQVHTIQWRTYDSEARLKAHGAELAQLIFGHERKLILGADEKVGVRSPVRLYEAALTVSVGDVLRLDWWFRLDCELRGTFVCHALRFPEPDLSRPLWPAVEP